MTPAKTPETRLVSAPEGLKSAGRKLWKAVATEFVLEPHTTPILAAACFQADRAEAARVEINRDGITTKDRFGQLREHPSVATERSASQAMKTLLRELGLDIVPEVRGNRRPGTRG